MTLHEGDPVTAVDILSDNEIVQCIAMDPTLSGIFVAVKRKCSQDDHSECRDILGMVKHGIICVCGDLTYGWMWCLGWEGEAVDALHVAAALRAR